jgi:hypothetical protein
MDKMRRYPTATAPVSIRTGDSLAIRRGKLIEELASFERTIRAAKETCSANYERTKAKMPKGDTLPDMAGRATLEYFNKFNLDDATELFYWLYVARKLDALIKAGFRIRDYDQELRALRLVAAKLRK